MKSHARVVVIGGGIVGCSVLYHLTRLGWSDVVLVERDELTSGATWHAAGLNHLYAESPFLTRIAKESFDLYQSLEAQDGQAVGVHVCGGVRLAVNNDGIEEFKRYLEPAKAYGVEAEIIGPNRVRELFPILESDDVIGALHTPGEGYVDASMTTHALAARARSAGAEIYRQTTVAGLYQSPSGEWLVNTDKGTLGTEYVVNCAGSWGGEISKLLGAYLPVVTLEHQYLVTEQTNALNGLTAELPVLRGPHVPFYCRQEQRALMVSGFEHQAKFNWLDGAPDNFSMDLYAPDLERAQPCLEASFEAVPILKQLGIRTIVNGPIPATPDMLGLLGPAHGLRNYFTCCGIHGGFVQGGLTRYLAEWIVEGEPSVDLSSVDVRRFGGYADQDFTVARIRAAHTMFSLPAHYPAMEPEGGRPARQDALYDRLEARGAVFGVVNGWEVANWFASQGVSAIDTPSFERPNWFEHVGAECRHVREQAGLINLSAVSKFFVTGVGATHFLTRLCTNPLPAIGTRSASPMLAPSGRLELLVRIERQGEHRYFITAPPMAELRLADWLNHHRDGEDVSVENVAEDHIVLLLAGPGARGILERVCGLPLKDVCTNELVETFISPHPVTLLRVDDIDTCSWEVQCRPADSVGVYDTLVGTQGVCDFGMRAWDSLRLERGLLRWGGELSSEMTLNAAGLGHLVDVEKGDFIGRGALINDGVVRDQYELVMLQVDDSHLPIDPWGGEIVEADGRVIGAVTSAARGHSTKKSLAFAQLESGHAYTGATVQVVLLGERHEAMIQPLPVSATQMGIV